MLNTIFIICGFLTLALIVTYYFIYWVYIYPPLKQIGKASFINSFFLYGQNIADIWEAEKLSQEDTIKGKIALIKKIGLAIIFMIIIDVILFLSKTVITGTV